MTQPEPIDEETVALDQAVIAAGRELALAELSKPRDPQRVSAAFAALLAAMAARWPDE